MSLIKCFYNAQKFVLDFPLACYYEGLCWLVNTPFDHAWVVWDGKLYDFTIEAMKVKELRAATPYYLGLPVPLEFIAERAIVSGQYDSVGPLFYLKKKRRKPRGPLA